MKVVWINAYKLYRSKTIQFTCGYSSEKKAHEATKRSLALGDRWIGLPIRIELPVTSKEYQEYREQNKTRIQNLKNDSSLDQRI
jgi:hypothetical protein